MEIDHLSLTETLNTLNDSISNLHDSISNLHVCLQEHKEQTTGKLAHLQNSFSSTQSFLAHQSGQISNKINGLSSELDTLNTSLFQHQQQTTTELGHLQTSLNSTNLNLNSLTAIATKLSSDHQEIQTNISYVQCMDTQQSLQLHQNLQDNITHQLMKIQDCVTFICGSYHCGGTGGWRRVVYLSMTDPHTTCPCGWNMTGYSIRTCGRNNTGIRTCDSATFPVSGGEYSRVCGRIKAYQSGPTQGFFSYHRREVTTINGAYAGGVSLTHGTPRNHIWTFVAGTSESDTYMFENCPCDATSTIRIPPFVGNDYFCESGVNEPWGNSNNYIFHPNDTLWDGEDCLPSSTCCSQRNPPYFTKQLPTPTTDDIEARICLRPSIIHTNLAVELVELYVK